MRVHAGFNCGKRAEERAGHAARSSKSRLLATSSHQPGKVFQQQQQMASTQQPVLYLLKCRQNDAPSALMMLSWNAKGLSGKLQIDLTLVESIPSCARSSGMMLHKRSFPQCKEGVMQASCASDVLQHSTHTSLTTILRTHMSNQPDTRRRVTSSRSRQTAPAARPTSRAPRRHPPRSAARSSPAS